VKGQFNQPEVTIWGFICDGKGRTTAEANQAAK